MDTDGPVLREDTEVQSSDVQGSQVQNIDVHTNDSRSSELHSSDVERSLECQYQLRKDDLVWRGVAEETIILDLRTSLYLSLNTAAAHLWQSLEKGATERQLTDSLSTEFGIAADRANEDVKAFIARCQERDLLEPTG